MDTIISESNRENYETDINEKQHLQSNELPIYKFCLKLLDILLDNIAKPSFLLPNLFEIVNNIFSILHETKSEWSSLNLVSNK